MRAVRLRAFGAPLVLEAVGDPVAGPGAVVVDVLAAAVLPYAAEVFSGARRYPLELPVVPGCGAIGRVRASGVDATRLQPGELVWCDPTVRSRDGGEAPDITLQGWSSRGEGGLALARHWHDGPFAERMLVPAENVVPLGGIAPGEVARWCALGVGLVPFGGLLAAGFAPGETLLVSGATGHYGSAAVSVGLAMGAGAVVAAGRNGRVLADLVRRFGSRVVAVELSGEADADTVRMREAAAGGIDCVLDLLPPAAPASAARAAVMAVRPYGRAVLMGGVGMLGGEELALPYPWIMRNCVRVIGQWMYPPEAPARLARLAHSGLFDLAQFEVDEFRLEDANAAVEHAAAHGGPFRITAVCPAGT